MSNRKLVSFRLPDDLMQALREQADHEDISATELVCRLLRQGLQQGLQSDGSERVVSVDKRIASLEAEVQELRQLKQSTGLVSPTPLYTLLAQSSVPQESDTETRSRLTRLEQMLEILITQQNSPDNPQTTSCSEEAESTKVKKTAAHHKPNEYTRED